MAVPCDLPVVSSHVQTWTGVGSTSRTRTRMDHHHRAKKGKLSSSSGSSSSTSSSSNNPPHQDQQGPLSPPPVRPSLHLLPDVAYEALGCYLTSHETNRVLETCPSLLEVYSGRVHTIILHPYEKRSRGIVLSLLKRRSGVEVVLNAVWSAGMMELAAAMEMGYCNNLRRLEMGCCTALLQALRSGACPRLDQLVLVTDVHHGKNEWQQTNKQLG